MGQRLVAVKTPVSNVEMKAALSQSWQRLWSETPTDKSLYMLLAHWSLECGGAGSSMYNFNIGNKKGKANGAWGDFVMLPTFEFIAGERVNMDCPFRAYATLDLGVDDYLKGLRGNGNFAKAFPALQAGDPVEFVHQLKLARYFTADEKVYKQALSSRFYGFAAAGKFTNRDDLVAALISVGYQDVKSYQSARGLTVDGVPGPMTRGMLALEVGA